MTDIAGKLWLEGDTIISRRTQDVEPILDANALARSEQQTRAGTFRHVARIPNVIIEQWLNEGAPVLKMSKDEFARFVKKKLNDPDWAYLKTTGGRV